MSFFLFLFLSHRKNVSAGALINKIYRLGPRFLHLAQEEANRHYPSIV